MLEAERRRKNQLSCLTAFLAQQGLRRGQRWRWNQRLLGGTFCCGLPHVRRLAATGNDVSGMQDKKKTKILQGCVELGKLDGEAGDRPGANHEE